MRRKWVSATGPSYGKLCAKRGLTSQGAERTHHILEPGEAAAEQDDEPEHDVGHAIGNPQDDIALVALLKASAKQKDLHKGSLLHADILNRGLLRKNVFIGNTLIHMYAKCGALARAQDVFDKLPIRNLVSWNALLAGFCQQGHGNEALDCFHRMKGEGLSPNAVTFACVVKACGSIKAIERGEEMHAEIIREGLLADNVVLGNALVDMYAKCGVLEKAELLFDELPARNVVSWNALITGYCHHGHSTEALNRFAQMADEGFSPHAVTYACILKACGSIGAAEKGKEIHDELNRRGLLGNNTVLGSALVDMYAKCGALAKAQQLFDELPSRDVVAWTGLIAGYCQHGQGAEGLKCFDRMKREGIFPDAVTFAWILKACGSIKAADKGEEIHTEIVSKELLGNCSALGNAMVIDMYAKCGALPKAQQVLDELPVRDVASWTALITGYCQHGRGEEALNCLDRMRRDGFSPDAMTFACILKACGSIGAAERGEDIHAEIVRNGLLANNMVLGSALVDMYAKCGILLKAQKLFDELSVRDVVSWSSLIAGYCEHGHGEEALNCFEGMKRDGLSPDAVTFSCILKTCVSIGAAEKGQMYFESMSTSYGLTPTLEHYTYMVDLFSRAGHFDKAMGVIERMPSFDHYPAWLAVLAACQKWGNVKLGRLAFEHAVRLDEESAVAYACMSKLYAAVGMQEEADKMEALRNEKAAGKKSLHSSWVLNSNLEHDAASGVLTQGNITLAMLT